MSKPQEQADRDRLATGVVIVSIRAGDKEAKCYLHRHELLGCDLSMMPLQLREAIMALRGAYADGTVGTPRG